jgi:hypothetical protein
MRARACVCWLVRFLVCLGVVHRLFVYVAAGTKKPEQSKQAHAMRK